MLCILLANIIYSEIIDDKGDTDRSGIVRPQTWHGFALAVAVLFEALFKKLLGYDPGQW